MIQGKDSKYKFFWSGNKQGTAGIGILLAEKWIEKVFDVQRISDRIIMLKLIVGSTVLTVLSVYAPQVGLSEPEKDAFYDKLREVVAKIPEKEFLLPCGDWNGHIGKAAAGFEEVHGGLAYGDRNVEGERILEFAMVNNLVVGNSWFTKRDSHLITYSSGGASTQVDYILLRRRDRKLAIDIKVIPSEEWPPQHRLLVCDLRISAPRQQRRKFQPRLRTWKLRDPDVQQQFQQTFRDTVETTETTSTEE